jgi:hypothetical protein
MKWIMSFILICAGLVVLFMLGAWELGWLDALGNNPNIAIAAGLGILISSGLGAGLMALIFYSHRSGADDRAAQSQDELQRRHGRD